MMADIVTLMLIGAGLHVLFFRGDEPELTPQQRRLRSEAFTLGDALDVDWNVVSVDELQAGIQEELEHDDVTGGNKLLTAKIALAHLEEDPEYYTKLKSILG